MGGGFSVGGLITGLDSNQIISQLIQIERQPIVRIQQRIQALEQQRTGIRNLRTQLLTLRNRAQDFRFNTIFNQHKATSSDEKILTAAADGQNPVVGSYTVNVTRLASATVATSSGAMGRAIDPDAALNSSGLSTKVTGTKFSINGVQFAFDPETDSLNSILGQINASAAGVTATYDPVTDKVTVANTAAGDTSLINFGGSDDDSNLLAALGLTSATQSTNAGGSTEAASTINLGAVKASENLATANFGAGAVTSGTFSINGVTITIDTANDSLADVIQKINDSDAQVTASYDSATDTIRMVSKVMGSRTIRFTAGTSNFLAVTHLDTAVQTAGSDSQFSINGGPVQTRNSNVVTDAIGGVTLSLLSEGTSTVTVASDDDAVVEDINEFIAAFNDSISQLHTLLDRKGSAAGDGSLRLIENFLRTTFFTPVQGATGRFRSLAEIGITTGKNFDSEAVPKLEVDKEKFLEAFRDDHASVINLFANEGGTGIADEIFRYLDGVTSTGGFLNERIKSSGTIDDQIEAYNAQIERLETRVAQKERRLRAQFARLETMSASFQSQNSALSGLSRSLLRF